MKKKTNRVGNTFYFLPAISQPADMLELGENGDAHCFCHAEPAFVSIQLFPIEGKVRLMYISYCLFIYFL